MEMFEDGMSYSKTSAFYRTITYNHSLMQYNFFEPVCVLLIYGNCIQFILSFNLQVIYQS